jgi:hypothetical protein
MIVYFLKAKSEALAAFKQYTARLSTQHEGIHILKLCSDHGGEYIFTDFDQHLCAVSIKWELTVHDSPEQNGVAECLNGTLISLVRAMLLGRNLPKFLWAEAVSYATWLKNRLPSHAILGHTPYDLIHSSLPNISMAHEFGALCFVHLQDVSKLDARVEEAVFMGIDAQSKAYHIYWTGKCRVSVERNVTFTPTSVDIVDDVLAKGESATPGSSEVSTQTTSPANRQLTSPTAPSTPTKAPQPAETPLAP